MTLPKNEDATTLEPNLIELLCACAICAEDYSWPLTDVFWSNKAKKWICRECWRLEPHGGYGISAAHSAAHHFTPPTQAAEPNFIIFARLLAKELDEPTNYAFAAAITRAITEYGKR